MNIFIILLCDFTHEDNKTHPPLHPSALTFSIAHLGKCSLAAILVWQRITHQPSTLRDFPHRVLVTSRHYPHYYLVHRSSWHFSLMIDCSKESIAELPFSWPDCHDLESAASLVVVTLPLTLTLRVLCWIFRKAGKHLTKT